MSWGSTVHEHEQYGPREVAYDLGWSDGVDGRPIRDEEEFMPTEYRAYCDGYRLGEELRSDGSAAERLHVGDPLVFVEADALIRQVYDTRPGRFVAVVCVLVFVVMFLVVIFK
jgi:hypothetical protein